MAVVTSIANGDWIADAASVWDTGAIPAVGDTTLLNGHAIVVDGGISITNLLGAGAATLAFGAQTFDASNAMVLDSIEATAGAATITASSFAIGETAGRGKLTLTDDLTLTSDFELDGGELDMNSKDIAITGNIVYSSGTVSNRGTITQGGSNILDWGETTSIFDYHVEAGATITVDNGVSYVKSFTSGVGSTIQPDTTDALTIRQPSAGWWSSQLGTVAINVNVFVTNAAPGGDITLEDTNLAFQGNDTTITMDGAIDLGAGTLTVAGYTTGKNQILNMDIFSLTCDAVLLGTAAADTRDGDLNLGSGTHSIGSITGGHANNTDNTLALGTCAISMTTGIVGANIDTVTATAAHLYGNGTTTIKNVDISAGGTIYCYNFDKAGSTGNSGDIRFVSKLSAPPPSVFHRAPRRRLRRAFT